MDNDASKTNLIVNYLPQTLSDKEFRNLFKSIGPIEKAKIVRQKRSGYSYGFGFVEYKTETDAEKAIDSLNGSRLQNKKIKVAYARPSGKDIKSANLYIRNIPKSMTDEEFENLMAPYGKIINCKLVKDSTGKRNKGIGFVLYHKRKHAEDAIKHLHGQKIGNGKGILIVRFAEYNIKVREPATRSDRGYSANFNDSVPETLSEGGPHRNSLQERFRFNPMANNREIEPCGYSYPAYFKDSVPETLSGGGPFRNSLEERFHFNPMTNNREIDPYGYSYSGYFNHSVPETLSGGGPFRNSLEERFYFNSMTNSREIDPNGNSHSRYFNDSVPETLSGGGPLGNSLEEKFHFNPMTNNEKMDPYGNSHSGYFNDSVPETLSGGGPPRNSLEEKFNFNPMTNNAKMDQYGNSSSTSLTVGGEGHRLFVYNIGPNADEKTLWQLFARYGTVQKVTVIKGIDVGKVYGYVTMSNYDEAVFALQSLNGCNLFGKSLQISFTDPA